MVDADPTRLAQAFSNLLINAAKYTDPRGSIGLSAAVEGEQVLVAVEDDGIGFGPEVAGALFKPNVQLGSAGERARGGLGIGLSLVRGIATLHGGSVEAHSDGPGKGSRFVVRLPMAAPLDDELEVLRPDGAPAEAPVPSLRILVADDNKDSADSLQRLLSFSGHEVRVAYDGSAALTVAREFQPRVAVLDIGMPGANGYDVARAIRSRNGSSVTLIAMTGWGQEADRRRALEAGFDHHLTKPVDLSVLNELLVKVASK
jgi:CheY-like chemotaxis protein